MAVSAEAQEKVAELWQLHKASVSVGQSLREAAGLTLGQQTSLALAPGIVPAALIMADILHAHAGRLRNELVLHYTTLVRYVASKVAANLPPTVDRDDLVSYGMFGLMDAIQKFDLDKGFKFETYAITRIKGAIIDELRGQDRVPRSVRAKARNLDRANSELESELGRQPDDAELSGRLGISIPELWTLQREAAVAPVVPLEEPESDDRPNVGDQLFDAASNPEDLYGTSEIVELLAAAISTMDERPKTILALYYVEELTLASIGEVLGVTESRVCQLQGQLLGSLTEALLHGGVFAA